VRLQKHKSREVDGKEYFKWTVVIPPKEVEDLGWAEGVELESKTEKDKLLLKPTRIKSE
jgi:hypothetical protein